MNFKVDKLYVKQSVFQKLVLVESTVGSELKRLNFAFMNLALNTLTYNITLSFKQSCDMALKC